MKKYLKVTALLLSAVMLTSSCKDNSAAGENALIDDIIKEISAENAAAPQTAANTSEQTKQTEKETSASPKATDSLPEINEPVDLDMTQMSATMIYSVIYDMMINPGDYYGKSMIVDGYFDTMYSDEFQTRYYFVVVPDATACCVQGLEFKLPDEKTYPDDYPEVRDDIRVRGELDCYEEAGQTYAYIKADYVYRI
ncbi:MAG: hypothetical protein II820_03385 [Ruminiclostridium sp.]|nr:hypothetical protein [Ruminiclostridium sp.]